MSSDPSPVRVAIIGAGPAGCTLARLLLRGKVTVQIFEAESSLDMRNQGGTLDLHEDKGLLALKEAGLYDEFLKYARFDGDALSVCDKKMVRYIHLRSTAEGSWFSQRRPEIDRMRLRQLLLDSLPEGIIRWGRRLQRVGPEDQSLHFEDGTVDRGFDLVVGADGAFSKVRPLLSPEQPFYSGVGGYNMIIPNAEEKHPLLYRLVNRGSVFAFSDGKEVLGQQMGDGSIYVTEWSVRCPDWVDRKAGGEAVKAALREQYRDWSPEVRELLQAVDEDCITARLLFMLPVGMRWQHRRGVTLLGDAAHLMTPFAGEGVNSALMDAMMLGHAIVGAINDGPGTEALDRRIKIYEQNMFERVTPVQAKTEHIMELIFFTPGAPGTVIEQWIMAFITDGLNPAVLMFVKMMVYVYYFCFKIFYQ